jgi:hypothetical protein
MHFVRLAVLATLLAACRSTAPSKTGSDTNPAEPIGELVEATNTPDPIGKVLVDLDASIRAWTNLVMTARNEADRRKASQLEQSLMFVTHKRRDELIAELETGPPSNRIVAASALGFTRDDEAHSPLIAALEDSNPQVVANALIGLMLLGKQDTPLDRICQLLETSPVATIRNNAALCAANLVQGGARSDCILQASRLALHDQEPGVRAHCALILANLLDSQSLATIGDQIYDPVPLVGAACARAVAYIGGGNPPDRGPSARILVRAFENTKGPVKQEVQRALAQLAGGNYGDDIVEWQQWAARLP